LKETGTFSHIWGSTQSTEKGQFGTPYSIFYERIDEIFYIGDSCSVQLYTKDNVCIQRIGDVDTGSEMNQFCGIYGLCVKDENLYVSDWSNQRIQVFRRQQGP